MTSNEIIDTILDAAFNIHKKLGPGLFESVYEQILVYELTQECGYNVVTQQPVPVFWKEIKMDIGFKADIIVEESVIVEIKSIASLAPVHSKQLLTYLRLTNLRFGLLINFNEALLKNGISRLVNGY